MRPAGDDAERLSDLQQKWGRAWKIWRARHRNDIGDQRTGDWCATRLDPKAGPYPTVIQPTPEALNDALHDQADKAARGVNPVTISPAAPE